MKDSNNKPFFLFKVISPKRYLIFWLWSILIFIVLISIFLLFNNNINIVNSILFFVVVDVFLGIVFFIGTVLSFLSDIYNRKIYMKNMHIDKWFVLTVITVIIFTFLFYFKITNDREIKQKEETITVMKCLQLGSDNARAACLKKYKPTQ